MNALAFAVTPGMLLRVDETEYRVEFPLSAVIEAEERLGRSLKNPSDWFGAPAKELPALLRAGLSCHHPDVTEAEIKALCDRLNPEACGEIVEALGALAFPRFTAKVRENLDKVRTGGTPPKDPSAADL